MITNNRLLYLPFAETCQGIFGVAQFESRAGLCRATAQTEVTEVILWLPKSRLHPCTAEIKFELLGSSGGGLPSRVPCRREVVGHSYLRLQRHFGRLRVASSAISAHLTVSGTLIGRVKVGRCMHRPH